MARPFIVAIDGPAGAGKSTASRLVAAQLGFAMVDTGAIYRAVALAATRAGIALDDDPRLGDLLPDVEIRFAPPPAAGAGQRVLLGGEDVSQEIRTPPMSLGASKVSARPVVRAGLLELQRRLALAEGNAGAVLEGRDIGTVVFPEADAKFFLTAPPEERARRRHAELRSKGDPSTLEEVLERRGIALRPQLGVPAPGAHLRRGGEEELGVGIREHDRADVAPLEHRAGVPRREREPALQLEEARAHDGAGGHLARAERHGRGPDLERDVLGPEEHALPAAGVRSEADLHRG